MNRSTYITGAVFILIGGATINQYPPFDPSFWLMMFGVGMMFGSLTDKNRRADK